MNTQIGAAASAIALATGALASPASAQTKVVDVGGHGFKGAPKNLEALAFLRQVVSVHVGDRVKFRLRAGLIHTATFVPPGQPDPRFEAADPAHPVHGINDAGGQPFWFNGLPRLIINSEAAFPTAEQSVTGGAYVNSGIPSDPARGGSHTLKFPKTGTFRFVCLVHPGMAGSVKVLPRAARIPTAAEDAIVAKRELAAIVKRANSTARARTRAGQVEVGRTGRQFSLSAMFPGTTKVKAGQAVNFTMAGQSRLEIHTVTLGPEAVTAGLEKTLVSPEPNPTGPPTLVSNPIAAYPSDPPPTLPAFTGTNHGNGFLNAGVLDNDSSTPPPNSAQVTFTRPGTYHFECLIHPKMDGTVIVTP